MEKLIFSIYPSQVENERDLSIAGVFSQAWQSSLTIKNLDMLTFINENIQLHQQLKNEDVKYEDIDLMKEYLESKNKLESKNETI